MQSPNLVKIVAAFVAGVVIALGSALIYVRVSEMLHTPPVTELQTPVEATPEGTPVTPRSMPEGRIPPPSPTSVASIPVTVKKVVVPSHPAVQPAKKPASHWTPSRQVVVVPTPRKPQPKIASPLLARVRPSAVPLTQPVTYDVPPSEPAAADTVAPLDAPAPASVEPLPPVAPQPHVVTLAAGTPLPIRLAEPLSNDHNYTGDTFRGTLSEPIISDGFIIADRGSKVLGRIVNTDRGMMSLSLTEINTTDGQRVAVETNSSEHRAQARTGQDVATIAGGAALGAIIGAAAGGDKGAAIGAGLGSAAGTGVVLGMPRRGVNLPTETQITFRLSAPLSITEKLN